MIPNLYDKCFGIRGHLRLDLFCWRKTEKTIGMGSSADSQNRSEWKGRHRGRLVRQSQPPVEKNRLSNGYDDDDDFVKGRLVLIRFFKVYIKILFGYHYENTSM